MYITLYYLLSLVCDILMTHLDVVVHYTVLFAVIGMSQCDILTTQLDIVVHDPVLFAVIGM